MLAPRRLSAPSVLPIIEAIATKLEAVVHVVATHIVIVVRGSSVNFLLKLFGHGLDCGIALLDLDVGREVVLGDCEIELFLF